MSGPARTRVHASTVAIDIHAVVIRGRSGSGKSDLALRLIDTGAVLVADDQTIIELLSGGLVASAPDTIRGRIEVRGLGIISLPDAGPTPIGLIVDLMPQRDIRRLPVEPELHTSIIGIDVPRIAVDPALPGAVAKIRAALRALRIKSDADVSLVSTRDRC